MEVDPRTDSDTDNSTELNSQELRNEEAAEIQSHLHGDDNEEQQSLNTDSKTEEDNLKSLMNDGGENEEAGGDEYSSRNGDQNDEEETDEEDEEEDNVQITIGDFSKATSTSGGIFNTYGMSNINLNLNKSGRQFGQNAAGTPAGTKASKSSLDIDSVGSYNGMPIYDLNLDNLEDKPWRKPGADITDYFNYGFNEDSWKVYCDRQRKIRSMNSTNQFDINSVLNMNPIQLKLDPSRDALLSLAGKAALIDHPIPIASVNENSKYNSSGSIVINTNKKPGPPPGRKVAGSIDVIGGSLIPGGVLPPPPLLAPMTSRPTLQPANSSSNPSTPTSTTESNAKENFISVLGNRGSGNPPLPFPPPLNMPPPFGFPPPPHEFPPGIRPPMAILPPPIGPNGQPLPFAPPGPDGFPLRPFPPGTGMLPHPDGGRQYEDDRYDHDSRRRMSPKFDSRDSHHSSSYSSSSGARSRSSYRDFEERSSRHGSYRERNEYKERSRERSRSREKDYESSRRHRSDRKDKDKERDREKEHHREKESSSSKAKTSSSSSSSKRESTSSDHKHRHSGSSSSKSSKSKRDKSRERDSARKDRKDDD